MGLWASDPEEDKDACLRRSLRTPPRTEGKGYRGEIVGKPDTGKRHPLPRGRRRRREVEALDWGGEKEGDGCLREMRSQGERRLRYPG